MALDRREVGSVVSVGAMQTAPAVAGVATAASPISAARRVSDELTESGLKCPLAWVMIEASWFGLGVVRCSQAPGGPTCFCNQNKCITFI